MIGFKIIGEMSKEDLIEEILAAQRAKLTATDVSALKVAVINHRVEATRDALVVEAGLTVQSGPFGTTLITDETSE
ncbi:MAG TPA: hypothetical protein VIY48_20185 [Candidatus Paceibacterota bacterium]